MTPTARPARSQQPTVEGRFVLCHYCDGSRVVVVGKFPARWPDGSENIEERTCPECQGEGVVELETRPVELNDDEEC